MLRLLSAALIFIVAIGATFLPAASVAAGEGTTPKVAVIVGPVGPTLTPHYLRWAEWTAAAAEEAGAVVERAFSPDATSENVLAAVADANIIIYYGHGWGNPSPYTANPAAQNGWGLNTARSTDHSDSTSAGTMAYYGADWLRANVKPAPGFVMVYAHVCYAPGAADGPAGASTPRQALERATNYSQPIFDLGASAYFANDFYRGAEGIVSRLLVDPEMIYGAVYAADERYYAPAVMENAHPAREDARLLQQRSTMIISDEYDANGSGGARTDYFMAFAGNPEATPAATWNVTYDSEPPVVTRVLPSPSSQHAAASGAITVTFDEAVVGTDAYNFILNDVTEMPSFINVPSTVSYDAETFTVTVIPPAALTPGHRYEIYVREGIADKAGHAMERPYWTQFTVDGTAPELSRSYPDTNQLFPAHHDLRLFANEPLQVADAELISLRASGGEPVALSTSVGPDGELIVDPVEALDFNASYTLNVADGAITDLAGNPLAGLTRSFETDEAAASADFLPRSLAPGELAGARISEVDVDVVLNPADEPVLVTSRGTAADRPGYWFTSGEYRIAEGAVAHLPGLIGRSELWTRRLPEATNSVILPAGDHVGLAVDAAGVVTTGARASLDEPAKVTASERAWIDGIPHLLITEGIWADQWLPEAGLMLELPSLPGTPLGQGLRQ